MKTYCNVEMLSFLISYFNDIITNFGSNKKSIDFYRNQINNLENIGQVDSNSVEIINDLINFSYINDSEKWSTELEKVAFFTNVMDLILSNANTIDAAETILFRIEMNEKSSKDMKKVLNTIRKVFNIKRKLPENTEMKHTSQFGTNAFSKKNIRVSSNTDIDEIIRLSGAQAVLRVSNPDAVCSGDTQWYNFNISKELLNKQSEINKINKYIKRGAEIFIALPVVNSNGCSSYTTYKKNTDATEALLKFLEDNR